MTYALPADVDERPVVIEGAGTLGRRIAAVYAAGGSDVRNGATKPSTEDL
jgi:3-hydroxybutyryl-CoA dehydrogenase